nr:hypothetical protein CFP56_62367 [Quercus suber]
MLQQVRIATGFGAAGLRAASCMRCCWIEFVEVDAFRADFILVVMTVVGPFRNILSRTFDATVREDTALDPVELKR